MGNFGYGARFRNIKNATSPWIKWRRRPDEGDGKTPDVELKSGGRWRRPARRGQLWAQAGVYLLFLGMAAVLSYAIHLGDTREPRIVMAYGFLIACVVIGTVVLWSGRFSEPLKVLLTFPLLSTLLFVFV